MIKSRAALIFRSILDSDLDDVNLFKLLKSTEKLIEKEKFEDLPYGFITHIIHEFYLMPMGSIRYILLFICMELELKAPESISQKYNLDLLIASSLTRILPDPQPKVDKEKIAAFMYLKVLVSQRKIFPPSTARALVAVYQHNKSRFRDLAAQTICLGLTYVPEIGRIPEVNQVVFDYLNETANSAVSGLVSYSMENYLPLVSDQNLLYSLLLPIASIKGVENMAMSITGLVAILRTWPGVIYFGLQCGAFEAILNCVSSSTEGVSTVLSRILNLEAPSDSIVIPFSSFVLQSLLKCGLIRELRALKEHKPQSSALLTSLIPFANEEDLLTQPPVSPDTRLPPPRIPMSDEPALHPITSVAALQLHQDPQRWDWPSIELVLTIVLPHSETEARSQAARNLYGRLFDFFSGPFLRVSHSKSSVMSRTFVTFINLLMMWQWGFTIIENSAAFKQAVGYVLEEICGDHLVESSSSIWVIFKGVTQLMSRNGGVATLSRWGTLPMLQQLGEKCTNVKNGEQVLRMITMSPDPEMSVTVYAKFLSSTHDDGMHRVALEELRNKRSEPGNFCTNVFNGIILPHVKDLYADGHSVKLMRCLALVHEVIATDPQCLMAAAADQQLHHVVMDSSPGIYARILSCPDALATADIQAEVEYWIEEGNRRYVKIYDQAVMASMRANVDKTREQFPEILATGKHAVTPPHLFSELAKNPEGRKALEAALPRVIEYTKSESVKERRGAVLALGHFASNPECAEISDRMGLASAVISALDGRSYVLMGSVMASLSMFHLTRSFGEAITENGFMLTEFGKVKTVIPQDVLKFMKEHNTVQPPPTHKCELEGEDLVVYKKILQMMNPLLSRECRAQIQQMLASQHQSFTDPKVAIEVHRALASYTFSPDTRQAIINFFADTPLVNPKVYSVEEEAIKDAIEIVKNSVPLADPDFTRIVDNIPADLDS